jgi:hypothetical protein
MSDTDTQVDTEATEAEVIHGSTEGQAEEATEADEHKRPKTAYAGADFEMEALDELPDNPRAGTGAGRSKIYYSLLEQVAEQGIDNKWRPLARFGTSTGAKTVATTLNRQVEGKIGEGKGLIKKEQVRDIPEYDGCHWVFDSRRVPSDTEEGKIESVLYAKLVADEG